MTAAARNGLIRAMIWTTAVPRRSAGGPPPGASMGGRRRLDKPRAAGKKMPRNPPAKGAAAEAPVPRGEFNGDVLGVLKATFPGDEENLAPEKFKDDPHRANKKFRRAIFTASNGKKVEVFIDKED